MELKDSIDPPAFRTPISGDTSSDEVFQLTRQWMSRCQCPATDIPSSYPARLVSLEQLKKQDYFYTSTLESTNRVSTEVKLVETKDWEDDRPAQQNFGYVTLSHCWGRIVSAEHERAKLTSDNIEEFKRGIELCNLPKTFRHAIEFAARLPYVGFIWIDSLCIKQGDTDDWLEQSASMDKVYRNAFLNISATAATNSGEGLFFPRRPKILVEDEIILNIAGLPGAKSTSHDSVAQPPKTEQPLLQTLVASWPILQLYWLMSYLLGLVYLHRNYLLLDQTRYSGTIDMESKDLSVPESGFDPPKKSHASLVDDAHNKVLGTTGTDAKSKDLRRCTILDVSFWTDRVDEAPVNKRGWVLQERLMAHRVLHFCRDQVAWECCEFEVAEGQPDGIPNFQLMASGIREGSRLKGLDVVTDGGWLRRMRLQDYDDPDPHLQPGIYALELWRRIVEVYSKTSVTQPGDKLIALSGMARWMSQKIDTSAMAVQLRYINSANGEGNPITGTSQYVAGLWTLHLASQLLWYAEPTFRWVDSSFQHLTEAPPAYRAPSFSWAAIDAEQGNGIKYGEVTDRDLLIDVEEISVTPRKGSDEFGILDNAHIVLQGKLRKAALFGKDKGRFRWNLVDRGDLDNEEHTIVYLDCPKRDSKKVLGLDAGIFVMPAAIGPRTTSKESKYMTCLILQLDKSYEAGPTGPAGPAFRRIGLTKLSPYGDHKALDGVDEMEILKAYESDIAMPCLDYDPATGKHRIVLI
jgi:hypothetical protein